MKCQVCGRTLKVKRQDYQYAESGLKHIVIANAPVYFCLRHGAQGLATEKVNGLHETIAQAILQRREPLTGAEIRFFRKYHGWNQTQLATLLSVTRVTVSNWERQTTPVAPANQDRLYLLLTNPKTFEDLRLRPKQQRKAQPAIRVPLPRGKKRVMASAAAA